MTNEESTKIRALRAVVESLRSDLTVALVAAETARDEATSPEAKAESKYDTRSIESGYLAGARAKRVGELRVALGRFELLLRQPVSGSSASRYVVARPEGGESSAFLLGPGSAGVIVELDGMRVRVLTTASPLGSCLADAEEGDELVVRLDGGARIERWFVEHVE
jgi:hypothetical protein